MYRRIYNKNFLYPNGTLIDNWYEEESLRQRTGTTRSIPNKNFPKKFMDFENPITNPNPRDDTFKRIINDNHNGFYTTTYSTYGNFKNPEKKYMHEGVRESNFNKFLDEEIDRQRKIKSALRPQRLLDSNMKNTIIPQYNFNQFDNQKKGERLMLTQDCFPILKDKAKKVLDESKIYWEQHLTKKGNNVNQGKYESVNLGFQENDNFRYGDNNENNNINNNINNNNINNNNNNNVNYNNNNNVSYNIGNYKLLSFNNENINNKNYNPNFNHNQIFKSMPLQNEPYPKYVYNMDNIQQDKKMPNENINTNIDISYYDNKRILNEIRIKILNDLRKKGWTGIRQFKMYLRSLKNYTTDYIEKTEFKYYSYKFGLISLNDNDFDIIYKNFDHKCNNTINFIEYLNSLHFNNEERKKLIYTLLKSMKMKNNYVDYKDIQSKIDMNQHPEVLRYEKNKDQVAYEYNSTWDNLKEDDFITVNNFIEYFEDISCMFENDREFKQCLCSVGLRN